MLFVLLLLYLFIFQHTYSLIYDIKILVIENKYLKTVYMGDGNDNYRADDNGDDDVDDDFT